MRHEEEWINVERREVSTSRDEGSSGWRGSRETTTLERCWESECDFHDLATTSGHFISHTALSAFPRIQFFYLTIITAAVAVFLHRSPPVFASKDLVCRGQRYLSFRDRQSLELHSQGARVGLGAVRFGSAIREVVDYF